MNLKPLEFENLSNQGEHKIDCEHGDGFAYLILGVPEFFKDATQLSLLHAGFLASDGSHLARWA